MKKILVIGGGFAGLSFIRSMKKNSPDWEITLLSEESYTTFNPMLPEVVGATAFPEQVIVPLRELTDRARFVMGTVTNVDFTAQRVFCETLNGAMDFAYDHLVLCYGCRAHASLIPGQMEYGHVLKTVGDAVHLRNLILRRLARMELVADPLQRRKLGHFLVIGGGFSGVETVGAIADFVHNIMPYYPLVRREETKISLLHDNEYLLPQLPKSLGAAALRALEKRGINVALKGAAAQITEDQVILKSGERFDSATVIVTIGTVTNPLTTLLAETGRLQVERGRIICEADCRVRGFANVWAIGDCAQIPAPTKEGAASTAPPTAQFAVAEGKFLARCFATLDTQDMAAAAANLPRFSYLSRGMMATVGHRNGVAEVFGLPMTGLPAWLLWRAYYLSQIPSRLRKLRLFAEWTWGMFFRPDITHLRFIRSNEAHAGIRNQLDRVM